MPNRFSDKSRFEEMIEEFMEETADLLEKKLNRQLTEKEEEDLIKFIESLDFDI